MPSKHKRATILLEQGQTKAPILKRLSAAGFKVESHLDEIGAVTGTVPEDKLSYLKSIKGVKAVEAEQSYQLPPPDSDVQ